ncbi:MAG: HD domain-containing protein [Desulfofustis sp.]|jgi:hypothetical protein|nr:HD domain-containing protein [Desulfofustis sp.]
MIFPALKREVHLRLLKRISAVCLLTCACIVGLALFLEYRRIEPALLDAAEKEARLFVPQLLAQDAGPPESADALAYTSFIAVRLYGENGAVLLDKARPGGDEITRLFSSRGISLQPSGDRIGTWIYRDKRLYLYSMIPVAGLQDDDIIGHVETIYRSSLQDITALLRRLGLSCLIGAGGVILCALLMYPALVLFHNRLIRNSSELNRANTFLLKHLGSALAKADVADPGHSHRVLIYGVRLAENQKLSRPQIRHFIHGAFLHDIGMLDLHSQTVLRRGPLTPEERSAMQEHPKKGAALIKPCRWLKQSRDIIRCHHENYDGSGYPAGLSHEQIPFSARIFAIVDAFDALTTKRPYRDPLDVDKAVERLESKSGTQFDPVLLAAFIEIAPKLREVVSNLEGKALERELSGVLKKYIST